MNSSGKYQVLRQIITGMERSNPIIIVPAINSEFSRLLSAVK